MEATLNDGTWLGERIRGNTATGNVLFVATDNGIVRVEPQGNGVLSQVSRFPDTEQFVDTGCFLFATPNGIYVVRRGTISLIQIQP